MYTCVGLIQHNPDHTHTHGNVGFPCFMGIFLKRNGFYAVQMVYSIPYLNPTPKPMNLRSPYRDKYQYTHIVIVKFLLEINCKITVFSVKFIYFLCFFFRVFFLSFLLFYTFLLKTFCRKYLLKKSGFFFYSVLFIMSK